MKIKRCISAIAIVLCALFQAMWICAVEQQSLDHVAAVADEDVIMASELAARIQMVQAQIRQSGSAAPPQEQLQHQVLERLIVERLQLQMATRAGIKVTDEQLQQALANIAAQNRLDADAFRRAVTQRGMTWEAFRASISNEILMQEVQRATVTKRVTVTDQDVDNFLKTKEGHDLAQQAAEAAPVVQTHARHILIKTSVIRNDDEARALLQKLLADIKKPEDFAKAAKNYSEDTDSAMQGGDLGWITPGQMTPEFEKELDATPAGQISPPFRTQFGWHLIQIMDRRQQKMGEDALRQQAQIILRKRRYQEELPRWLKEIRDKAYVKISP